MGAQISTTSIKNTAPTGLYSSHQIHAIEQSWFAKGHASFGLMQQAAWQITQKIEQLYERRVSSHHDRVYCRKDSPQRASIWVGRGNNGGDGWLVAHYLQQAGWQVQVITVGLEQHDLIIDTQTTDGNETNDDPTLTDAQKALQTALASHCDYKRFEDECVQDSDLRDVFSADIYVDALFGIGLSRAPTGIYKDAIQAFNQSVKRHNGLAVAIDVPSGLVASTGVVYHQVAIQADITLCLIARKFGLHTKDGRDYSGEVIDIPLIPYKQVQYINCQHQKNDDKKNSLKEKNVENDNAHNGDQKATPIIEPVAALLTAAHSMSQRRQNSYKGSHGHVLIIGGNRIDGSQGMGGAAILSASSTMATGAGKLTVACHEAFHGSLLTSLPDAMTLNLHDTDSVISLIEQASIVAIGMGLGRDTAAKSLFVTYIKAAIANEVSIVIDADGLYHLASLYQDKHELINDLHQYTQNNLVCLTPHSGEAARLLDIEVGEVESDRLQAIQQCAATYGGHWVLKGAGSLVLEQESQQNNIYVCDVGNAGMATAGMGDVLSGVVAGLLAQQDLSALARSVHQAVLIHGLAGDVLVNRGAKTHHDAEPLLIGQRGLQAQDMPAAIRHVMQLLIN